MKFPKVFRVILFFVIPSWLITYGIVSFFRPQFSFANKKQELAFHKSKNDNVAYTNVLLDTIKTDIDNLVLHGEFLETYLRLEKRGKLLVEPKVKSSFGELNRYYQVLSQSENFSEKSIGIYGSVLLSIDRYDYNNFDSLFQVVNLTEFESLPYYNLLKSILTLDDEQEIAYLEKEIEINPLNEKAYNDLLYELIEKYDVAEVEYYYYLSQKHSVKLDYLIQHRAARIISLHEYIKTMFLPYFEYNNLVELVMAVLVFIIWLIFLIQTDIFKEMKAINYILFLLLPLVICPLVGLLYDLYFENTELIFLSGSFLRQFFVVALIEEFIKLFPVVILLGIVYKTVRTPYLIFIAASMSALVFSFQENILYFGQYYDASIASSRAVLSVTMHIVATGISTYGIVLFNANRKSWYMIPLCYLLAMFVHAFYNTLLGWGFDFLAMLLVLVGFIAWGSMLGNALGNSPLFNVERISKLSNRSISLIVLLTLIITVEFLVIAFQSGYEAAVPVFKAAVIQNGWLMIAIGLSFMRLHPQKGKWKLIDFASFEGIELFGSVNGKEIELQMMFQNPVLSKGQILKAKVCHKFKSKGGENWYLLSIEHPIYTSVLVKFKEDGENFYDFNVYMMMHEVKDVKPKDSLVLMDFPFIGLIKVRPLKQK